MPRKSEPARLWRKPSSGIWYIRYEGKRQLSTRTRDSRQAEAALARFIAERERPQQGVRDPHRMTVSDALLLYGSEHAPTKRDTERTGYAIAAMVPIIGDLPLASINAATCRFYERARDRAAGTVRRELAVLSAAVNWCHREGYLTSAPCVTLPPKPPARDRWLTRDEAARLLWSAYRDPETRHLARFILTCLYTGTRKAAVLGLRFMPSTTGGWVDTERERMHRRGRGVAETTKRQPPIPLPRQLLAHLRRWERKGARHVVEYKGDAVGDIKTAWRRVLRRAGIEHCTPHDLRRTAITWALQHGAPAFEVSGYFGVSLRTIEAHYAQHSPDYMQGTRRAMERRGESVLQHTYRRA